jgi:predicted DNA-binding transcriptional regulator AlpA
MSIEIPNPPVADHGVEQLITEREFCRLLCISTETAKRLRVRGQGPKFVVLCGRRMAYRPSDVKAWLAEHERGAGRIYSYNRTKASNTTVLVKT